MSKQKDNKTRSAQQKSVLPSRSEVLFEASMDGCCVLDLSGKIQEINSSMCNIIGYSREELLKMSIADIDVCETPEQTAEHIDMIMRQGCSRFETKCRCKDGKVIDVEVSARYCELDQKKAFFAFLRNITERKQAEEELKCHQENLESLVEERTQSLQESESKYKTLVESAGLAVCSYDQDGTLLFMNKYGAQGLGCTPQDLIGKSMWDIFPKQYADRNMQYITKVLQSNTMYSGTHESVICGEKKWHDIRVWPLLKTDGKPDSVVVVANDITDQKQAEDKLQALIYGMDHCGEGLAMVNLEGIVQYTNKAFAEMHGYLPAEILGKSIPVFHLSQHMAAVSAANRQMISAGSFLGELWHSRRDGSTFLGYMNNVLLKDNSGNVIGTICTLQDITERKEAEEKLYKSEEELRAILGSSTDCILVWDQNYNYLYANENARKHVGVPQDKVIKNIFDGLDHIPDFMQLWMGRIDKVFETGKPMRVKDSGLVGERYVYSESTLSPIKDKKGDIFAVGVVYRDVSEKRLMEIERENYKEKLLKAQRHAYIGSMGAIVAHQVSQPLTKINILLDRAIEQIEESSCCPIVLKNIKDGLVETKEATSIIRKFRQYSKDSALESMDKVNISAVANKIVSVLSERIIPVKMCISVKDLVHLPEIEANEAALEQIFLIIIQNAIEAADARKAHSLDISGQIADDNIELQFADDCCGIAPENLDRVFESFFSTKPEGKGMGLGLDIVQQILIGCGGQIRVESELGKGTTFYVTLPICNRLES